MTVVKIRKAAQITLPTKLRKALKVEEGDYLEAELVEGGVLLRPVAVVDRGTAWRRIEEARERAAWTGPGPRPSEDEVMREVIEEIEAARREDAARRSR